jgi:hypothetical protein
VDGTWTIAELAEQAADALLAGPGGPGESSRQLSGRVRQVPNDRLIRWYVTVGLVDPPLSRAGRTARYGRRHLLQLVAIKRRQAEGRSLAEIQAELVGATSSYLESVAAIGSDELAADGQPAPCPEPAGVLEAAGSRRFWAQEPLAAVPGHVTTARAARTAARTATPLRQPAERAHPGTDGPVQAFRLAPGVVVVLEAAGPDLRPADIAGLRRAAAPLISALARGGYCTEPADEERKQP